MSDVVFTGRSQRNGTGVGVLAETLSEKSFALWEDARRVFREAEAAHHAYASKTVEGIKLIARLYLSEVARWDDFLTQIDVTRPRRGPISQSRFHGLAKLVLEISRDDDGRASRLAAILDRWHSERDRVAPDQIPDWIADQGGLTRLYDAIRDQGIGSGRSWRRWPQPNDSVASGAGHGVPDAHRIDFSTSSTEWYTPPRVFDAMDVQFDLDVASPGPETVPWIPAKRHYTKRDDGLASPWLGFVWMNSAWGLRNGVMHWIDKFIEHGNGVALTADWTSTEWWHRLAAHCEYILFVRPKLQFLPDIGTTNTLGSTLFSIGSMGARAIQNAERNGLGTHLRRDAG